ncbi:mitochondrial carrier domain-containing protein [Pilobolus umbonatus]|nr:mitochondrial carrier domain-containing protein [Pilobolus umbonatus]
MRKASEVTLPLSLLLSPGSTQPPENEEDEEEWEQTRSLSYSISQAEKDIISTVRINRATGTREMKENVSGVVLAITTMVANYSLSFPIVATRHRQQALAYAHSYLNDTPMNAVHTLYATYQQGGLRSIYPGFGLRLLGQAVSGGYEQIVQRVMSHTPKPIRTIFSPLLNFVIHIPLYPLHRNALLYRIQSNDTQLIHNYRDLWTLYKHDLASFSLTRIREHKDSAFIPCCVANILVEKLLVYNYRWIFQSLVPKKKKKKKAKESTVLQTYYSEITCALLSSIMTRTIGYPMDTILFKLMVQDRVFSEKKYTGFLDCVITTWQQGGWRAFYPGWGPALLEIGVSYMVLETSWWIYRAIQWKLDHPKIKARK